MMHVAMATEIFFLSHHTLN